MVVVSATDPPFICTGRRIDVVGVGRVGKPDPPDDPIGTGFLVGETALRQCHVLNILSGGVRTRPGQAVVRFKRIRPGSR